jgi:LmbE family N-acetylglucosaminyl deacetylase
VVIGHPDDEILGCGGTIRKIADAGADVTVLLALQRTDPRGRQNWGELLGCLERSCERLGATSAVMQPLPLEPQAEPEVHLVHDTLVPWVERAETVFTHWTGDVNQAHRGVSRAVEIATRPFRRRRDVFLFEIPTSTDQAYFQNFMPNTWFVLEESHCRAAIDAMTGYEIEHAPGRAPADLQRRFQYRGAQVGAEYAEAFVAVRRFE